MVLQTQTLRNEILFERLISTKYHDLCCINFCEFISTEEILPRARASLARR